MADTVRTKSALLALFPDNIIGDISAQDQRDFLVSTMGSITRTAVNAATYNLATDDIMLHVTYTVTGTVVITLLTAQMNDGRVVHVCDAGGNATANNIVINTEGSEKISGQDTQTINVNNNSISLYSDGSNWFIF